MIKLSAALCLVFAIPAVAVAQKEASPIVGDLRASGSSELQALFSDWSKEFARRHPQIRIVPKLKGRASASYGLEMRTTDIALMDRPLNPFELYGTYERSWTYPVQVEVGTVSAYGIYVHPANPLRRLTLAQLDGIFGAQRDGGWNRLAWNTKAARKADKNIRTWGQLGIKGQLANQPIHAYGPAIEGQGALSGFQMMAMQGGATWNEDYREFADPAAMFEALGKDNLSIAYADIGSAPKGMVPLAISANGSGAFVRPDPTNIANRTYALARPLYLYFTIDTVQGDPAPVNPVVRAFGRFVLSAAGQGILADVSRYAPLPENMVQRQLQIIESDAWPVERPRP